MKQSQRTSSIGSGIDSSKSSFCIESSAKRRLDGTPPPSSHAGTAHHARTRTTTYSTKENGASFYENPIYHPQQSQLQSSISSKVFSSGKSLERQCSKSSINNNRSSSNNSSAILNERTPATTASNIPKNNTSTHQKQPQKQRTNSFNSIVYEDSQSKRSSTSQNKRIKNSLSFIEAINSSLASASNNMHSAQPEFDNPPTSEESFSQSQQSRLPPSGKRSSSGVDEANSFTFSKLNLIRQNLKNDTELLASKEKQQDQLRGFILKMEKNFEERQQEIGLAINEAEEFNNEQQIQMKEQPSQRATAVRTIFINSENLVASLQRVDSILRELSRGRNEAQFDSFQERKSIALGALQRVFAEKERVILDIYSKQDFLEYAAENQSMAEEDLAAHEMRNINLIGEMEELEALLEVFKQNEDDTQIQQQINLRNVWFCLVNERHKLTLRIDEAQKQLGEYETSQSQVQTQIDAQTAQITSYSMQTTNQRNTYLAEELNQIEYLKTQLRGMGMEAFNEIASLFDGASAASSIFEESYSMFSQEPEQSEFQKSMRKLCVCFQEVVLEEFAWLSQRYQEFTYSNESESHYTNTKAALLSTIPPHFAASSYFTKLSNLQDINAIFNRILVNSYATFHNSNMQISQSVTRILNSKKATFSRTFDASAQLCQFKHTAQVQTNQLIEIQDEKVALLARIDQMKTREIELREEIERSEHNTLPFFATQPVIQKQSSTSHLMPQKSYLFDDTTGSLNKTRITPIPQSSNIITPLTILNDLNTSSFHVPHLRDINASAIHPNPSNINYSFTLNNTSYNNQTMLQALRGNAPEDGYLHTSDRSLLLQKDYPPQPFLSSANVATATNPLASYAHQIHDAPSEKSYFSSSRILNINNNNCNTTTNNNNNISSTSQILPIPASTYFQEQYKRKQQVDAIFERMAQIKMQRESSLRAVRDLRASMEKQLIATKRVESESETLTNDLLLLNGMQREQADCILRLYQELFSTLIESSQETSFLDYLINIITTKQSTSNFNDVNLLISALTFFRTSETLTPSVKLKSLKAKLQEILSERKSMLDSENQALSQLSSQISEIQNRITRNKAILSNKFGAKETFDIPRTNTPGSSHDQANLSFSNGQSLSLSDLQDSQQHSQFQQNRFFNNNDIYSNQNEESVKRGAIPHFQQQQHYLQDQLDSNDKTRMNNDDRRLNMLRGLLPKVRIHQTLLDMEAVCDEQDKENRMSRQFNEALGGEGVLLFKMFQVNQGNLVKSTIFDPLIQKKHPTLCGYGVRRLTITDEFVQFSNPRNASIDIQLRRENFTNIFIHPVTIDIIKHKAAASAIQEGRISKTLLPQKKFVEAVYFPFALEVKQMGRVECICESLESLKLIYTLFVNLLWEIDVATVQQRGSTSSAASQYSATSSASSHQIQQQQLQLQQQQSFQVQLQQQQQQQQQQRQQSLRNN